VVVTAKGRNDLSKQSAGVSISALTRERSDVFAGSLYGHAVGH